jgi:very-short-patch-repair endonuclease
VKQLVQEPPPSQQLLSILRKSLYQSWVERMIDVDERLRDFRAGYNDQLVQDFAKLDRKLVKLSGSRVIERYNQRKPSAIYVQAQDSEIGLLRREAAKKRRHLPVRNLFENIPSLLLRLKPCLLMSPLSVSQYLHPERIKFDVVIFDEASQIFTEDAVVAMYRGKQIVVAGDSKQLPPTDFFRTLEDDDDVEFDEDPTLISSSDFKSVLDECGSVLPSLSLRWHYRSRHESLIAFSNHQFYKGKLVTFPSAQNTHETLGIEFVYLSDGSYDRGGKRNNIREAKVVADRVFAHFERYPKKSLGVVAFSQAQMNAIEDEIERRRRDSLQFESFFAVNRLDGFFVKNLENVQGDERDVIIFSVGYGYDQQHRITMNFGPLNRSGGEHRLNVAITRAREKVILITSIKSSDIDLDATDSAGVRNLYHYLDYAERGVVALGMTIAPKGEYDSTLEEDVANEIRGLGYKVVPQVGCSGYRIDLGIVDPAEPGRFILGVECDGATYHSAATARDRDRLRQQILENQGWRIHRIWGPNWIRNRSREIQEFRSKLRAVKAIPFEISANRGVDDPVIPASTVVHSSFESPRALPGTTEYAISKLRTPSAKYSDFYAPESLDYQSTLVVEIVSVEGPVHLSIVTQRLMSVWGLTRTGSRITHIVKSAAALAQRQGSITKKGEFFWAQGMLPINLATLSVRIPRIGHDQTYRDFDCVAAEEIQRAMLLIVEHSFGIKREALLQETSRLFGFQRVGDHIRTCLSNNLRSLLRMKMVQEDGDLIHLRPRGI